MPATAGRVRMPANNRVHSSAALQTHGIWQSAIGYDPYAPAERSKHQAPHPPPYQSLLTIIRATGSTSDETRGGCRKCGRVGHLTFQCRNFLCVKDLDMDDDVEAGIRRAASSQAKLDEFRKKTSGGSSDAEEGSAEDDEEDSYDSSDSDIDPELERIIAKRELHKDGSKQSREEEKKEKKTSRQRRSSRGRSKHRRSSSKEDKKKSRRKRRERSCEEDSETDSDKKIKRRHHRKSSKEERERGRSRHRRRSYDDDSSDDDHHTLRRRRRRRRKDAFDRQ
uniref:CCHC-type domain-containing protein n=1 Tax=Oryza barthii TaxID=65489 RepID=A0A0D3G5L9_9ORYZ